MHPVRSRAHALTRRPYVGTTERMLLQHLLRFSSCTPTHRQQENRVAFGVQPNAAGTETRGYREGTVNAMQLPTSARSSAHAAPAGAPVGAVCARGGILPALTRSW